MKRNTVNRGLVVVSCGSPANKPFLVEAPVALSAVQVPLTLKKPSPPPDPDQLPPAA